MALPVFCWRALLFCGVVITFHFPILCFSAFGQVSHSCNGHTSTWHQHAGDGYWQSWWKITTWEPEYVIATLPKKSVTEWERLVDRIHSNFDCDPSEASVAVEHTVTHTVSVGGDFEIGGRLEWAAGALFAKCQAEAHAKVSFNRQYTDSEQETIRINSSKLIGPCKQVQYVYDKLRRERGYEVEAADARFTCTDHYTGNSVTYYCNRGKLVGDGVGWNEVQDGWKFLKYICNCDETDPQSRPVPSPGGTQSGGASSGPAPIPVPAVNSVNSGG